MEANETGEKFAAEDIEQVRILSQGGKVGDAQAGRQTGRSMHTGRHALTA